MDWFFMVMNMVIAIALPVGLIVLLVWTCRSLRNTKIRLENLEKRLAALEEKGNKYNQ